MRKFEYTSGVYDYSSGFHFSLGSNDIQILSTVLRTQGRQNDVLWAHIVSQLNEDISFGNTDNNTVHESS